MTFKSYVSPQQKITKDLFDQYTSTNETIKNKAKHTITEITLKNLNQQQWLTYIDYIDLKVYTSNVLPENGMELIVVLNLSKDQSVVGIYRPIGNEYVFSSKIENILPIETIDFMPIPDLGYNFMISHHLIDERLGGFFIERFVRIYMYSDRQFKSIWQETKYSEEIYRLQWLDPTASANHWNKITINNLIRFESTPALHIILETNQKKFSTTHEDIPSASMFKLQDLFCSIETFYWHPAYKHFVIGEGLLKSTGKPVAILTNTEHSKESFLGYLSKNYRILTSDGKIEYTSKDNLTLKKP